MTTATRHRAALAIACITGLLIGMAAHHSARAYTTGNAATPANAATKAPRPMLSPDADGNGKPHHYRILLADMKAERDGRDLLALIERMASEELRAAMASWGEEPWLDAKQHEQMAKAMDLAAAELYKRDGTKALEWAEQSGKKEVFASMVQAIAANELEAGRPWLERLNTLHGDLAAASASADIRQAARMRGSEDLLKAEALYDANLVIRVPEFAEGFDFMSYLKRSEQRSEDGDAFRYLAAADPEAAAQDLLASSRQQGRLNHLSSTIFALEGRAAMSTEEEAAEWISGVASRLEEGPRERLITALADQENSERRIQALIGKLPSDEDRVALTRQFMMSAKTDAQALTALRALPGENLRIRAIESRWQNCDALQRSNPEFLTGMKGEMETLMDQISLSPAGREQVRSFLTLEEEP